MSSMENNSPAASTGQSAAESLQHGQNDQPHPPDRAMPLRYKPKASPVTSIGTKVWDITERFSNAAAALQTGQLVKHDHFTLFESVGALEIMDPKMDSGFLQPGESLEIEYDVSQELLPDEVLGIMDQLLCYEMAWQQGYPLSQTIFTSVHIDKLLWPESKSLAQVQFNQASSEPSQFQTNNILRAFCIGLIKTCDLVIRSITSKDYFEEEDFCTHTYNRQLLTHVTDEDVLTILMEAREPLESEQRNGTGAITSDLSNALHSRLLLREHLLMTMSSRLHIDVNQFDWLMIMEMLPSIQNTHVLAKAVPDAFSSKLQRRLTSTAPPRPIVDLSFEDAFKVFHNLCKNCQDALSCTDVGLQGPQSLLQFIWVFNSSKPEPLAYPRSCLASTIFNNSDEAFEDLLRKDLETLVLRADPILDPINWTVEPPVASVSSPDPRGMQAALIDEFTSRCLPAYLEFWTTLCQNRCRIRRLLTHTIISFDQLQAECGSLDEDVHRVAPNISIQFPFSTWIYHLKLRQMEWIVQLGFEHDIYLPDELPGMYAWLSEIAATRAGLLDDIMLLITSRYSKLEDQGDTERAAAVAEHREYIDSLLSEARGTALLADALSTLYANLAYLGLLKVPGRPYSEPALRHEVRMKPFLTITIPRVPDYEGFASLSEPFGPYNNPQVPLSDITNSLGGDADVKIKEAKAEFTGMKRLGAEAAFADKVLGEWHKKIQDLILSCIAASVAVATLRDANKELEGKQAKDLLSVDIPEPGKRYHDWFIVPKVVKKSPSDP